MRLKGKRIVVTGGGSGIGAAAAHRFTEEGATVAIADIDESAALRTLSEVKKCDPGSVAISVEILAGGQADDSVGYFIRPTLIQASKPDYRTMCEELFGPVVTLYVYPENEWPQTLELVNNTSPYALTGAVFAEDRGAIADAHRELRYAAGNFYVNDKPTAAVVGQQPFGGSRAHELYLKVVSRIS